MAPSIISTEIWVKANRIFDQVSRLDPACRQQRTEELCADDPQLRDCVQRLIGADEALDGSVPDPISQPAAEGLDSEIRQDMIQALALQGQALTGQNLGPWQLTRCIGEGGMGGVYFAQRAGPGNPREAAVKVLKPGLDPQRFVLERQVLEKLDHPNIAGLLDGGTLADGRPYVVMEYIRGQRIDRYLQGRSLQTVMRLFETLCRAVAHAHSMLVVHRDIKPSNVLVGENHRLKLLDFGIAKLMAESSGLEGVSTASALRPMTPEYSSPEQLLGDTISTRTDVYLLGVLLHELLSGGNPLKHSTQAQRLRAISQDTTASAPSATACADSPIARCTSRLQRTDLDRMVQMAMAVRPKDRYQSVGELLADVQRYLAGRPVQARGHNRLYTLAKFFSRNPVASALGAATLALAVSFSLLSARQNLALQQQIVETSRENHRAETITSLLIDALTEADPTRNYAHQSARDVLLKAAQQLDSAPTEANAGLARLRLAVASVMARLDMLGDAANQLRQLVAIIDPLPPQQPGPLSARPAGNATPATLSAYAVAQPAPDFPHSAEGAPNGAGLSPQQRVELFRLLTHIAIETGRWSSARQHLARAQLELTSAPWDESISGARIDLQVYAGRLHARSGQPGRASDAYEQAIRLARQQYTEPSSSLAYISLEYSEMLLASGDAEHAEALLEYAHGNAPRVLEKSPFWVQMIRAQARTALRQGNYERALVVYNRGLARASSHYGNQSEAVATMLSGMGTASERLGDRAAATRLYLQAFEISAAHASPGDFLLVQRSLNLSQLLSLEGRHHHAADLLGTRLARHYALAPDPHPEAPLFEQALARLHLNANNALGASSSYQKALLINQDLPFTPARGRFGVQTLCELSILNGYDWRLLPLRLLESCLPGARRHALNEGFPSQPSWPSSATIDTRLLEELD